jgi:CubicO group peptidase (beta-lactamase class C family)
VRIFTTASLLFLMLYLINFSAFALNETQSNKTSLVDKLNLILSKQQIDKPGVSVLVKKDNAVILKFSKGLANEDKNLSISSSTGFRIGSISKPFTALAIMKLVEQDKLSLDDEVTHFIPKLPNSWQGITIKHLLSHRVSISNDFFSESNLHLANQSTNKHLIKFLSYKNIKVKALAFDKAQYCNSCYVLLAEVIAKASGASFSDYLNKSIFTPANMKNTYIVEKGISIKSSDALNYAKTDSFSGIKQYTTGAMAQVSSIDDLELFIIALKQGQIIHQKSLHLMTQVHADLGNDGTFGFGWMIGWGDKPFFSHGGSQDGYQSELFIDPKYDLEVVILTNGGDDTYALQSQIMRAILSHDH